MSRFRDSRSVRPIHKALNRRTANNIKKNIVKQGKRRAISRILRPKKEKEAIATWRLSLNRILCALEVRSVDSRNHCRSTNFSFQIEFGSGESVTISGTHNDDEDPHTAVVGVHSGISSAETVTLVTPRDIQSSHLVSEIPTEVANAHAVSHETHRDAPESRDGKGNPSCSVSPIYTSSASE